MSRRKQLFPKHPRLRNHLVPRLSEGQIRSGDALPSETDLADSAGISRNTPRRVLAELERDGLIQRSRGGSTFVHEEAMHPVRLLDEMRFLERPHDDPTEIVLPVVLSGGEALGSAPAGNK